MLNAARSPDWRECAQASRWQRRSNRLAADAPTHRRQATRRARGSSTERQLRRQRRRSTPRRAASCQHHTPSVRAWSECRCREMLSVSQTLLGSISFRHAASATPQRYAATARERSARARPKRARHAAKDARARTRWACARATRSRTRAAPSRQAAAAHCVHARRAATATERVISDTSATRCQLAMRGTHPARHAATEQRRRRACTSLIIATQLARTRARAHSHALHRRNSTASRRRFSAYAPRARRAAACCRHRTRVCRAPRFASANAPWRANASLSAAASTREVVSACQVHKALRSDAAA
eukprot:1977281-Pleurochrysis_carterae.AAC.2